MKLRQFLKKNSAAVELIASVHFYNYTRVKTYNAANKPAALKRPTNVMMSIKSTKLTQLKELGAPVPNFSYSEVSLYYSTGCELGCYWVGGGVRGGRG